MTSDTPKSAMTSVTDILLVSVSLAAQGAPRATGAVKETSGQCLSEPVVALVNDYLVHRNAEFLSSHIDGRDHIFVNHFGRHSELFTKDIQHRITTNETHQVVAAALRFGQRMFGSGGRFRKTDLRSSQSHLRRAPLQLGVAIPRVMFRFKDQRLALEFCSSLHDHPAQETTPVMVIEFFHHAITPGFSQRDEPRLNSVCETQADQTTHTARVILTPIENHLVVYLLMFWYSQTPPVSPNSVDRWLRRFTKNRRHRTATSGNVYAVHAVEAQRTSQVTRPDIVALMYIVDLLAQQLRIRLALRLIAPGATMSQALATNYPADGSQARQRRNLQGFQLPTDGLSSAEQALVIEMKPRQLDRFDDFSRQLSRIAMWPSGLICLPIVCFAAGLIALNPLVDPRPPITKLLGNRRYRFAFQVRPYCMFSVALLLLLHTFLPIEKGPDDETTALQPLNKLVFQRTVTDVMALRRVLDVMTLVTYAPGSMLSPAPQADPVAIPTSRDTDLTSRELTIIYIAMCVLGSLQSEWPVEPPSARTCAV